MYRTPEEIQRWLLKSSHPGTDDKNTPNTSSHSAFPLLAQQAPDINTALPRPPSLASATSMTPRSPSITSTNASSDRCNREPGCLSTSLVKTIVGLQRLEKPVYFEALLENAEKDQLPGDVRDLFTNIWNIVMLSQGVFPTEIRDEIERPNRKMAPGIFRGAEHRARDSGQERLGERSGQDAAHDVFIDFPAVWALPRAVSHSSTTPARLARAEFHHVRNLEVDARKCLALHRSEASWNCNVHKPLLDLALWKYCDSIALENATSARILPAFIPALVTGEAIRGKMVDFVLSPNFTAAGRTASQSSHISNATIDAAILKRLAMQPSAGSRNLGVNHTDYPPLLRAPTAVTIATMIGSGSLEDGRVRLGIWTAAWHIRMAALGISGWEDGPLLPTLPLILTHEHQWSLYFAVDRGHKIEILGGIQIGTTSTTQGIYQLLAVLRLLADWIETEFKEWVVTAFTEDTS